MNIHICVAFSLILAVTVKNLQLHLNIHINVFFNFSSGGKCISPEYTDEIGALASRYGLKLHIDGARIFNASAVGHKGVLL